MVVLWGGCPTIGWLSYEMVVLLWSEWFSSYGVVVLLMGWLSYQVVILLRSGCPNKEWLSYCGMVVLRRSGSPTMGWLS